MLDVAVVGGGPAGLAAALALRRAAPQLSVKVYEATPDMRPRGAGVMVHVNGWRAFDAIDRELGQRLWATRMWYGSMDMLASDGTLLRSIPLGDITSDLLEKSGWHPGMVFWHRIRTEIHDMLPEGTLQLGHRLRSCSTEPDGTVAAAFDTGDGLVHVRARTLIGADGFYSRVRTAGLGGAPPVFAGHVIWRGALRLDTCPEVDAWLRERDPEIKTVYRWVDDVAKGFSFENRFVAMHPIDAGTVGFTANAPAAWLEGAGLTYDMETRAVVAKGAGGAGEAAPYDTFLAVFHDFPEIIRQVVLAVGPAGVSEHGIFDRPGGGANEDGAWGCGSITLIGDAAHVGPPTGQGLNLGVEDAAVLAACVKRHGLSPQTLRDFERARIPRVVNISKWPERSPERTQLVLENVVEPLGEQSAKA